MNIKTLLKLAYFIPKKQNKTNEIFLIPNSTFVGSIKRENIKIIFNKYEISLSVTF